MSSEPKPKDVPTKNSLRHASDSTLPAELPEPRPRSGSLNQLFNHPESAHGGSLFTRRGSLSRLFTGSYHFDKEHNYLGQALNDSIDDLDTFSQISDSGFSDVSHNTQTSGDVTTGLRKNASLNNLALCEDGQDNTQTLPRNSSSGNLCDKTGMIPSVPAADLVAIKEKAQQNRLSHSMVWNWVKNHQVRIDENSTLDSNVQMAGDEDRHFGKSKYKVSKRDLNAFGPTGW